MRAVFRLALHDFRRSIRRQITVFFLIAAVVAGSIILNIAARSTNDVNRATEAYYGNAESVVGMSASDGIMILERQLEEANIGYSKRNTSQITLPWGRAEVDSIDPTHRHAKTIFYKVEGRKAEDESEIAISDDGADRFDFAIGDFLPTSPTTSAEIVGIFHKSSNWTWSRPVATIYPYNYNFESQNAQTIYSIDASRAEIDAVTYEPLLESELLLDYLTIERRIKETSFISVIALLGVASFAAVSFLISGKRRQKEYWRLHGIGASPMKILFVVVLEALIIALAASAVGAITALVTAFAVPSFVSWLGVTILGGSIITRELDVASVDMLWPCFVAVASVAVAAAGPAVTIVRGTYQDAKQHGSKRKRSILIFFAIWMVLAGYYFFTSSRSVFSMFIPSLLIFSAVIFFGVRWFSAHRMRFAWLSFLQRHVIQTTFRHPLQLAIAVIPIVLLFSFTMLIVQADQNVLVFTDGEIERPQYYARDWTGKSNLSMEQEQTIGVNNFTIDASNNYLPDDIAIENQLWVDVLIFEEEQDFNVVVVTPELMEVLDISPEQLNKPQTLFTLSGFQSDRSGSGLENYAVESLNVKPSYELSTIFSDSYLISESKIIELTNAKEKGLQLIYSASGWSESERDALGKIGFRFASHGTYEFGISWQNQILIAGVVGAFIILIMRSLSNFLAVEVDVELRTLDAIGAAKGFRKRFLGFQAFLIPACAFLLAAIIASIFFLLAFRSSPVGSAKLWDNIIQGDFSSFAWPTILTLLVVPFVAGFFTMVTFRESTTVEKRLT